MVLKFDLRQTMRPVESITGLTVNPVHSIQCLSTDVSLGSGTRSVLTASSVGLCHWNFGSHGERLVSMCDLIYLCWNFTFSYNLLQKCKPE